MGGTDKVMGWKVNPAPLERRPTNNSVLSGTAYHPSVASSARRRDIHGRTDWSAKYV